jgi:hypothetical protein
VIQQTFAANEIHHLLHAFAAAQVGENERLVATHFLRIAGHRVQIRTDMGSQIGLVDIPLLFSGGGWMLAGLT